MDEKINCITHIQIHTYTRTAYTQAHKHTLDILGGDTGERETINIFNTRTKKVKFRIIFGFSDYGFSASSGLWQALLSFSSVNTNELPSIEPERKKRVCALVCLCARTRLVFV